MTDETKTKDTIAPEKIDENGTVEGIEQKIKNLPKLFKDITDISKIKKDFNKLDKGKINKVKINNQTIIT